jgi:dihydrofolate reductase
MKGGTTFYFVTDGIESALEQAKAAAGDKDVRIGGGPATVRQFLNAGLIDEMHLVLRPVLLGKGEPLFNGLDLRKLGYKCSEWTSGERGIHMMITRSANS